MTSRVLHLLRDWPTEPTPPARGSTYSVQTVHAEGVGSTTRVSVALEHIRGTKHAGLIIENGKALTNSEGASDDDHVSLCLTSPEALRNLIAALVALHNSHDGARMLETIG